MLKTFLILLALAAGLTAQKASTTLYGTACRGSYFSTSLPVLGKKFDATMQNNDATTVAVGVGFARANVQLSSSPRCYLLVGGLWQVFFFSSLGGVGGGFLFTIPNDPGLKGVRFTLQAVADDRAGLAWSNGVEAVVGSL